MLIDIIVLLMLLAYTLSGYRKGLLMSLCTLTIVVMSGLGATLAQELLTPQAVSYAEPLVAEMLETKLKTQLESGTQAMLEQQENQGLTVGGESYSLGELADLLGQFGLDVEEKIAEGAGDAMKPAISSAAGAIAHALVPPIMEMVIYLAAYLVLYLALQNLTLVVNLVEHLPVISTLNALGGAAFGLLSGLLLLTIFSVLMARSEFLPGSAVPGISGEVYRALAARFA